MIGSNVVPVSNRQLFDITPALGHNAMTLPWRSIMRRLLFAVLTCLVFAHADARAAGQSRPPNVVILLADDMGYADVGFQGCKDIPTPNIDGLAKKGVRFTSGYVSGPYCSPTRAGLLTGRYQTRFGHEFNPGKGNGLRLSETTIVQRFRTLGYATGLIGKRHLGDTAKMHPSARGFQDFFGFLGGSNSYLSGKNILRGSE